ncbi:MAG: VanZ family protein [Ruminococcus sp.]|nr:VanZ family protein [Ruminococcus sp.]
MQEIIKNIIANVLTALYQPFSFAVILTVLFTFLYLFAHERGWKTVFRQWWNTFKSSVNFRKIFLLSFYTSMILFRTLLNRTMCANPVSNVIGVWGLHDDKGQLTTEVLENLALFIPFAILFLWSFREKILEKTVTIVNVLWQSAKVTFLFSLTIEFLQLFLRLGTFQLSDLFFNTLGGLFGGFIYWICYKVKHRR